MEIYVPKLSNILAATHEIKRLYLFDINTELDVLTRGLAVLHDQISPVDLIPHVISSIINGSRSVIDDLYNAASTEYRVNLRLKELDYNVLANSLSMVNANITNKIFSLCVKDDMYLVTPNGCFKQGASLLYLDVRLETNLIVGIVYAER